MRKYVYKNATVYITIPTEEQIENIRKSTERFVTRLAKEGLIQNEKRRNNSRIGITDPNARKRAHRAARKA